MSHHNKAITPNLENDMSNIIIKNRWNGSVIYDGGTTNLCDANLRDADLRGANLCDANLRGAKNVPLVVNGLRWIVQISGTGWMQIGCQKHSVIDWNSFDDDRISSMSGDALTFWKSHKQMLMGLCATWVHADEEK